MKRQSAPVPPEALGVVALAVLVAAAAILTGRHVSGLQAERDAAAGAASSVGVVVEAVRTDLVEAARAPRAGADPNGGSTADATLARDSGAPVLDDAAGGQIVVAVYDTASTPDSVQARRDHVIGYHVVPLDLASVLGPLKPAEGGIAVSGPDGPVLALPSKRPGSARSATVSLRPGPAAAWSLTVWTRAPRTPAIASLIALLSLLAGAAVVGWLAFRRIGSRRREQELEGLQESNATVAELAILAQHSLDLGEALPAVTTELSSSLALRGLSLTVPTGPTERPIFVWGVAPEESAPANPPDRVPAGGTLALALSRGGRVLARLRVRAGRDLDRHDIRTLVAAGDILTSALANAEAFSGQVELVRQMRAVDELKTNFLATASHELRTPVVALSGYAGLLHANWDQLTPENARDYAERVDTLAQRLSRLVEDILDFSRLEHGSALGEDSTVLDLGATVGQVLEEHPDISRDHQIAFEQTDGLRVTGSSQAIERVVTNLVGNAAKYSPAGTAIRVLVRAAAERVELVVEDDGPGIPALERDRVFSRFYRGSGDAVVRTRGAGLGLAIVSEFAGAMGGQVSVAEAPSGGCRFVVSYPVATPDPEPTRGVTHAQT